MTELTEAERETLDAWWRDDDAPHDVTSPRSLLEVVEAIVAAREKQSRAEAWDEGWLAQYHDDEDNPYDLRLADNKEN